MKQKYKSMRICRQYMMEVQKRPHLYGAWTQKRAIYSVNCGTERNYWISEDKACAS